MDEVLLIPIIVVATLVAGIVAITKIISDGRTRRRLIDKGATPELVTAIATMPQDAGLYDALRWGIVLGAVGLGLVLIQFLPYGANEPIVYGIVLVSGGAGFLVYHAAAKRMVAR